MVKTRHSQDTYEDPPENFLSLERRRSRLSRISGSKNDNGSDDSGVIQFKSKKLISSRNQDVSPESKRSLRASAKRVSYVEDFIDDGYPLRRRTRRPVIEDDDEEDGNTGGDEDEEEDVVENGESENFDQESGPEEVVVRRVGRPRRHPRTDIDNESPQHRSSRSGRRSSLERLSKQIKREQLQEREEEGVRRSTRTRNTVCNMEDMQQGTGIKRTRQEVDTDDVDDEEFKDMYSRVKRKRVSIKRDMYGMPVEESDEGENEEDEDSDNDSGSSEEEEEEDNEDEGKEEKKTSRGYFLRENKPRTQLYNAPLHEKRPRSQSRFFNEISTAHSPARRRLTKMTQFLSPARRKFGNRRRTAFHGDGSSSTTSSSSSDSSSDEEKFQRRKAKSMMKSRQRCLPMNLNAEDIAKSVLFRDRQKIGSSLADVDPMTIDRSTTFDSVGGLKKHIRALKEMVVFPLMYPEIFERFKITAPRGVLFYGPPGTGKTLVARALANECSSEDRRVAFYMRKGADCLSKWVGESERQLRLLFDQAYQTRPSIIFFDEIDGLAPVRSSRQDQIHSSIVSTLLALMDGLDSRGEIVVIGATNRIDSIDPALRRPGRFDREFLFPLPSLKARTQILKITTKEWNPKLCDKFVSEVAEKCVGYCGADVKALCTEAALLALRRRYPQIYTSSDKLQIDVSSINITAKDFYHGMKSIVPTSQRSMTSPARGLSAKVLPLLEAQFKEALGQLETIFPSILAQLSDLDNTEKEEAEGALEDVVVSDDDDQSMAIYEPRSNRKRKNDVSFSETTFFNFSSYAHSQPTTDRPRLLLCGSGDLAQSTHVGPALLHHMEQLPVHVLDLPALFANSVRTPEESCAQVFREACRTAPSIVYLPHISQWWTVVGETVRATLTTLIQDLNPVCPVLLLATSELLPTQMDIDLQLLLDDHSWEMITMRNPSKEERQNYFKDLLLKQATRGPPDQKVTAERLLEVLPKAPPPEPRTLTAAELNRIEEVEEATLTELRLFLRDTLNKLGRDRKFFIFTKPVDIEEVPDYYDIIKKPMDLSTMMSKIDLHQYESVKEFLSDINQICLNALEYNPDKDAQSRVIRHRACALKDMAYSIVKAELDPDFEKTCEGIIESRKQRGNNSSKNAPAFYHTRPLNTSGMHPLAIVKSRSTSQTSPSPVDANVRTSRRLHRGDPDPVPSLEEVERNARVVRSLIRRTHSPEKLASNEITPQGKKSHSAPNSTNISGPSETSQDKTTPGTSVKPTADSSGKKPGKKSIWGRSSYTSRKRKFWLKRKRCISEGNDYAKENGEEVKGDDSDLEKGDAGDEEKMDVSDAEHNSSKSNSVQNKVDIAESLTIDVCTRATREGSRLLSERSPRSHSQTSPSARSPRSESLPEQRSPRQRRSSGHRSPAHSETAQSPTKSPRTSSPCKGNKLLKGDTTSESQDHEELSNLPDTQDSVINTQEMKPESGQGDAACSSVAGQFVDSGIGSSDSNGDSNDSAGKLLRAAEADSQDGKGAFSNTQESQVTNETTEDVEMKDDGSPKIRVTRSRVQTKSQERAMNLLQMPRQPVIVDRERLVRLLDLTVLLTEGFTVALLEKLHCLYSQSIFQYRNEANKTAMIELMELRLKQFTSSMAARLQQAQPSTSAVIA